jgi:hypothetical protein
MLAVSALELGDPMPLRVLVKTSYSAHLESMIVNRGLSANRAGSLASSIRSRISSERSIPKPLTKP